VETLLRAGLSNAVAATLMAIVVLLVSRPLARRPAVLHGLWVLVLIKLVTPPIYAVPISWPIAAVAPSNRSIEVALVDVFVATDGEIDEGDGGFAEDACPGDGRPERSGAPCPLCRQPHFVRASSGLDRISLCRWMATIWLAGSAVVLLLSLRRIYRFQRLLSEARAGSWLEQDWVDEWAERIGLRRAAGLWWVPGPISPMIWFVGARPRLIVPQELWKRLDARQRSTLIVHELAHLRRGDHLVRLLELAVTALFWWHPLVWWMRVPLREAEEQCCDAWVVWALPDAVRAYAETLLDTLEFLQTSGRPDPLLASGLGKVPLLRRRLTMIMTGSSRRSPGLPGKLALLLVAGIMLPVGASWAQKADDPIEARIVVTDDRAQLAVLPDLAPGEIQVDGRVARIDGPAGKRVLVVTIDGNQQAGQKIEVAGSVEDVIKNLEAQLVDVELKGDVLTLSTSDEIKVLKQALDTIKSDDKVAQKKNEDSRGGKTITGKRVYVREMPLDTNHPDIAKLRKEVLDQRAAMEATLKKLQAAQARIRELGGDPGETPVVGWHRSGRSVKVEKRVAVLRDDNHPTAGPKRVYDDPTVTPDTPAAPKSDRQRLEQLEGRLKALQDEVVRLKKGAAEGGGN
jgi:beta-lactamase regulating signal transducer with metallopeptidase domain